MPDNIQIMAPIQFASEHELMWEIMFEQKQLATRSDDKKNKSILIMFKTLKGSILLLFKKQNTNMAKQQHYINIINKNWRKP